MSVIPSIASTVRSSISTMKPTWAISSARSISDLKRSLEISLTTPKRKKESVASLGRITKRRGRTSLLWNSEYLNSVKNWLQFFTIL